MHLPSPTYTFSIIVLRLTKQAPSLAMCIDLLVLTLSPSECELCYLQWAWLHWSDKKHKQHKTVGSWFARCCNAACWHEALCSLTFTKLMAQHGPDHDGMSGHICWYSWTWCSKNRGKECVHTFVKYTTLPNMKLRRRRTHVCWASGVMWCWKRVVVLDLQLELGPK